MNRANRTKAIHMKASPHSCLAVSVACLTASLVHLHAQTIQAILPSPDYLPAGIGTTVVLNPSSGEVLVGGYRYVDSLAPGDSTIHRLIPVGASFSAAGID